MPIDTTASSNASLVKSNQILFKDMWILFYRHGMNSTLQKNFSFAGSLPQAVDRAREHCKIMNYKYIFVRPLVCNLDEEEDQHLNRKASTGLGV